MGPAAPPLPRAGREGQSGLQGRHVERHQKCPAAAQAGSAPDSPMLSEPRGAARNLAVETTPRLRPFWSKSGPPSPGCCCRGGDGAAGGGGGAASPFGGPSSVLRLSAACSLTARQLGALRRKIGPIEARNSACTALHFTHPLLGCCCCSGACTPHLERFSLSRWM